MTIAEQLAKVTDRIVTTPPEKRAPLVASMLGLGAHASNRRNELDTELGKMWRWLDAHPNDERHDEREAAFLERLAEYEAVSDALARAIDALPVDVAFHRTGPVRVAGPTFPPGETCHACGTVIGPGGVCRTCHPDPKAKAA